MPTTYTYHALPPFLKARILSLPQGKITEIEFEGKKICVTKLEDTFYGFDAKCPHQGGKLVTGWINEECAVVCPWHRFAFDVKTGQAKSGGYYVDTYPFKYEEEKLWVGLPKKPWWMFW